MPTAVYIWYPHGKHIGHCSMHIGEHREEDNSEWYVSWWPDRQEGETNFNCTMGTCTFEEDKDIEGYPHVMYHIDEEKARLHYGHMKAEWDAIRGKAGARYKLFSKNCSTIVARVLD